MGLNLLLLVVGLVICFGGIYIRKVCSAILGLIWGAHVKVELGLCRGKKLYDKRDAAAARDAKREIDRTMKSARRGQF